MAQNPIRKIIGNVGQNPTAEVTATGKNVVNFTVADPVGYGRDVGEPNWHKVSIWDASIQEQVLNKIHKGDLVAVAGPVEERNVNGRTYRNMQGWRVGKVQLFVPQRDNFSGGGTVQQTEPQVKQTQAPDDDDLDWD
jgi:single-stranded DNA-binding protein